MAEMLLINPRRRRRAAKASVKRRVRRSSVRRAAPRRRRNPLPVAAVATAVRKRVARRSNPIGLAGRKRHHRRRRNPIAIGGSSISAKTIISMLKDAAIGGAGALAVDVIYGKLNPMLPMAIQTSATGVGIGDAVKAVITVVAGKALSKATKGMSQKAALGALTTQMRDIISTFLPAEMMVAGRLGYSTPGRVINMNTRVGPNRLAAYVQPGRTPLLSGMGAYNRPGSVSPLLNAAPMHASSTALREGFKYR